MPVNRWGSPAPSGPPMPVPEPERPMADVTYIPVRAVQEPSKPEDADELRIRMRVRAEQLRKDIEALGGKQAELSLLEKMLEVK